MSKLDLFSHKFIRRRFQKIAGNLQHLKYLFSSIEKVEMAYIAL